jgi:hypothetical protein
MYIGGDKYLHYVLTNMVIGSNSNGDVAAGYSINGVAYYIPYITRQGGGSNPWVVWCFSGSNTHIMVIESWYD